MVNRDPFGIFQDMTRKQKIVGLAVLAQSSKFNYSKEDKKLALEIAKEEVIPGYRSDCFDSSISDVLEEFPEIRQTKLPVKQKVSSVYSALNTVRRSFPDISRQKPTVNVKYSLSLAINGLVELCFLRGDMPALNNFIEMQTKKVLGEIEATEEYKMLKNMGRGFDGVYRLVRE